MFNLFNKTSYTFEGKKDDESVAVFLHRHWFTLVQKITVLTIMSLFPIVLLIVLGQVILEYKLIPLFTFLWAGYLMTLWYYLFYVLTMYTLDYWIVTNERIVNSTQQGFFNRKISELSIHMIQDISVKLVGLVPTTMNFGSVEVQTAAEQGHFFLEEVPNPQKVKDRIMEIIEKTEDELGPRMHGMTQRHHFHPDKYVTQRISNETEDTLADNEDEHVITNENANDTNNNENSAYSNNYDEGDAMTENNNPNNIPPNLPL